MTCLFGHFVAEFREGGSWQLSDTIGYDLEMRFRGRMGFKIGVLTKHGVEAYESALVLEGVRSCT